MRTSPVAATLHLKFLDFRIDVETNSLRAASRLQSYFRAYMVAPGAAPNMRLCAMRARPEYDESSLRAWEPPSGARPAKESYYDRGGVRFILKNRTGMLIKLREAEAAIIGDLDRNLNQTVNLIGTLFGLSLIDRGYAMFHASAVVRHDGDDAMIFLGNSGSGKSSLALQLMERGSFDYVSNDRVLVKVTRRGVHVVGLPKRPRVNPGTLLASSRLSRLLHPSKRPMYADMDIESLWGVEDKHDVDVTRTLGARERLEGRLTVAYSLEWKPAGHGLHLEPLGAAAALEAMRLTAKDFGPFDLHREARDDLAESRRIARAVRHVRVTGRSDPSLLARRLSPRVGVPRVGAPRRKVNGSLKLAARPHTPIARTASRS
jgi:HprK-related kinase B